MAMPPPWHFETTNEAETREAGKEIARTLQPGTVLCLFGDLAAGKTTLVKGIVEELTGISPEQVTSPTFTYLNIYPGPTPVYHFDLYRLKDADEFLSMGFEEMLYAKGICCIEWSERILPIVPINAMQVRLVHAGLDRRTIEVKIS